MNFRGINWHLCLLFACLGATQARYPEKLHVLPLGSSMTAGGEDGQAYRPRLLAFAQAAGMDLELVGTRGTPDAHQGEGLDPDHEGWEGYLIDGVGGDGRTRSLARALRETEAIGKLPIDLILLLVGSEDLKEDPPLPAEEISRRYHRLLDTIFEQNKGVLVLATGLPPIHPKPAVKAPTGEDITRFNDTLKALISQRVKERSERIVYVDPGPVFTDPAKQVMPSDGVSLTPFGFKTLGNLYYGSIQGIYWEADGLYEDSFELSDGWRSSHFGYLWDGEEKKAGWKFLQQLGWVYCPPGHASTFVYYHPEEGWRETSKEDFPESRSPTEAKSRPAPTAPMPSKIPPPYTGTRSSRPVDPTLSH